MTMRKERRVIVHIGPHKTGTTFLQSVFNENREHMRSHGITYVGQTVNHNAEYLLFCDHPHKEHEMIRRGYADPLSSAAHVERERSRFRAELEEPRTPALLLSAEEFCRLDEDGIRSFLDFVAPFSGIEVIAVAREPGPLMLSDAQEAIKGGLTFADLEECPQGANYTRTLGTWLSVVGRENMTVAPFPQNEPLHCLFARLLGIPPFPKVDPDARPNSSLSLNAAMILSALNREVPMFSGDRVNPARGRVPNSWLSAIPGPRFRLSDEAYTKTAEKTAAEVAWLEEHFGIHYQVPVPGGEPAPEDHPISEDVAYGFAMLFNRLASQMNGMVAEKLVALSHDQNGEERNKLLQRAYSIRPDNPHAKPALSELRAQAESIGKQNDAAKRIEGSRQENAPGIRS